MNSAAHSGSRKLFLPGAGGSAHFWLPVVERLSPEWDCHCLSWPGLGHEPHQAGVNGIDDLLELVLARLSGPTDVIAQSMGGVVALKLVLRVPDKVRRLVLTGTSGGLPVDALGGVDWRPRYREEFPRAASWITEVREDLSIRLPTISAPTLLLWGDRDAISPPSVGEALAALLPNATLRMIEGGDHDFPETHPDEVARLVGGHLG